jgi:hypothetical protein
MISIDEQIEYMRSIVATSLLPTHMPKSILASLEELKRIQAVQVPDEPDDSYWKNEAKRYAGNADYWRDRAEAAEAKLAEAKRDAERYLWIADNIDEFNRIQKENTGVEIEYAIDAAIKELK